MNTQEAQIDPIPLVVDLDGTLLRSDLLLESGMAFLRRHPLRFHQPLRWLGQGKAYLKERLAFAVDLDVATLPYEPQMIALLQEERAAGRTLVLATASHRRLAEQVADHLQLFDEVLATADGHNLSAENKRDALVERYGEGGFDYMGNATDDLPVWAAAREAWLVNADEPLAQRATAQGNVAGRLHGQRPAAADWVRAMRLHQWLKNLLILVPLLAAHQIFNGTAWTLALLAFLSFGLTASSVYLLNDLLDLADDRRHPHKRRRPFAAGLLPVRDGLLAVPLLLAGGFLLAVAFFPWKFLLVLAGYYLLTLAYSLALKRHVTIDVITLAMLYTARIVAGAAALGLPLTFWILAFSMFIFLSLALVKRYAELAEQHARGESGQTPGRGYYPEDMPILAAMGTASGYLAVLVLALYIHDQATVQMYHYAKAMWLACPLLLWWVTRIWLLTHRGEMHEDPVVFAARDRTSWLIAGLFLLAFWLAA